MTIEEIFSQAITKASAQERHAFLEQACAGDPGMRQRIDALFEALQGGEVIRKPARSAESTMGQSPDAVADPWPTVVAGSRSAADEGPGTVIGRYRLLEKIGEGGFGAVYVAEQKEPVRRRVALKVIKLGMDTRTVVARFEAERQALAMMDHPNIAKVLDVGATDTGRPFFVMELVRGISITQYCDENHLSPLVRLGLFVQICHAIQHAHQKGIIHRDIKPSNVLITLHDGVPIPKVIDFGIAKATQGDLTDKTIYTQFQQFIGTPAYMSPEQAEMSGLDIDTRSDIYSLGVLLYEMLTGKTPFDGKELMASGVDEMRKIIREKEVIRPSMRLSRMIGEESTTTASRLGVSEMSRLVSMLRGDLDWIVMKCLEKDRTRRYETANGLAMDIKRHLNNDPVEARPPSSGYKLRKLVRRNRMAFGAGAAVAIALVLGVIATSWMAVRARLAERTAVLAQAKEIEQRQKAQESEHSAIAAQANEAAQRRAAQAQAYASDIGLAQRALSDENLARAIELLNRGKPAPGQPDPRGWEWRYLWRQSRSDALYTLSQGTLPVYDLATSGDGRWLAVGEYTEVSLWDLRARRETARFLAGENPRAKFIRVAFSQHHPLLAITYAVDKPDGTLDGHVRVWNAEISQEIARIPLGAQTCLGLGFADDGGSITVISTGNAESVVDSYRLPDGQRIRRFPVHLRASLELGSPVAISPDLKLAAVADEKNITLIDLTDGKSLWTRPAAAEWVTATAFSRDGKKLATGSGFAAGTIRVWDVDSGNEVGVIEGHRSWISRLLFRPDGKTLVSASADQTIRIWDLTTFKPLSVLRGHRLEVWSLTQVPNEMTLISGSKDWQVLVWDTTTAAGGQKRLTLPDRFAAWCFAPDSASIVTFNHTGQIARWSGAQFSTPQVVLETGLANDIPPASRRAVFSPDARKLAMAPRSGVLEIWDLDQRRVQIRIEVPAGATRIGGFFDGGQKLITQRIDDLTLCIWDVQTGRLHSSWQRPPSTFPLLSPDQRQFAMLGTDGPSARRDMSSGAITASETVFLDANDAAYSPDGKLLAVASSLGHVTLHDSQTFAEIDRFKGFLLGLHSVAFSPDGKRMVAGSFGGEAVRLYDVENRRELITLPGEGSFFDATSFSPDGNLLGSMNRAGLLHIWTAPNWDEINQFERTGP